MPLPIPLSCERLEALAQAYGTPYQLYDEAGMRGNARSLISEFGSRFAGFRQFYAVKALPNPAVLRVLVSEGCGLDCSSTAELHIAALLGVPGEAVMYTSNYTSKKDLAIAFDQGVIINLDDASLVDALVHVRGRCPDLICFRLNPGLGRTDSETASNVLGGPDAKFGIPPFAIVDAYRRAQRAGATRFGIHMMTGSCVMNEAYWQETVTVLLNAMRDIHVELGIEFEFINIGGGLGIPYRPGQPGANVPALAQSLRQLVDDWTAQNPLPFVPRLFMENGRYMTGPFAWLVSRCEAAKDTYAKYYGLDACMANLMRPGMYGSYHHITVPARETFDGLTSITHAPDSPASPTADQGTSAAAPPADAAALDATPDNAHVPSAPVEPPTPSPLGPGRHAANVVGTLCENNDWFARGRDLPSAAAVGDLFVIHDTGAHAHSMGFQYNGKLRAPELLLRRDGVTVDVIRQRETIHCLYDNTLMPVDLQSGSLPPSLLLNGPSPKAGCGGCGLASSGSSSGVPLLSALYPPYPYHGRPLPPPAATGTHAAAYAQEGAGEAYASASATARVHAPAPAAAGASAASYAPRRGSSSGGRAHRTGAQMAAAMNKAQQPPSPAGTVAAVVALGVGAACVLWWVLGAGGGSPFSSLSSSAGRSSDAAGAGRSMSRFIREFKL